MGSPKYIQNIFKINPKTHIDVGSRIDGFVAHIATFRKILVIDIRSLEVSVSNIHFKQANACEPCPQELRCSADSVSCLHGLEHFGLGRYGDSLDPEGHKKGAEFLTALVTPGGFLYISVPIGPQRIEYNAHRVFSASGVVEIFSAGFELDNFCWIDDAGNLHEPIAWRTEELRNSFGCHYGCGIFKFRKKIQPKFKS